MQTTETHLLDDIEYNYVQARSNIRFCNFLIDRLILYGLWELLLFVFPRPLGMLIYTLSGGDRTAAFGVSYLLSAIVHILYYSSFEAATGGKTIGKFITRTRAVTTNGQRLSYKDALLRSVCRIIPFEPFSAFSNPSFPWHDSLSKTLVVDEKLTQLPPWN